MATENDIKQAIIKAHQSGDFAGAKILADSLKASKTTVVPQNPTNIDLPFNPPKATFGEKVDAVGEAGKTLGSGIVSGLGGFVVGGTKGIANSVTDGTFGTQVGAKNTQNAIDKQIEDYTFYTPKTKLGQKYTEKTIKNLSILDALPPTVGGIVEGGVINSLKASKHIADAKIPLIKIIPKNKPSINVTPIITQTDDLIASQITPKQTNNFTKPQTTNTISNRAINIESGGNYNAINKKSGAFGKYQFIPSTLKEYANKAGLTIEQAKTPQGQETIYKIFSADQNKGLIKKGIEPNEFNTYMAHQQGVSGWDRILKGDIDSTLTKNMLSNTPAKARLTGDVRTDFLNFWGKKFNGTNTSTAIPKIDTPITDTIQTPKIQQILDDSINTETPLITNDISTLKIDEPILKSSQNPKDMSTDELINNVTKKDTLSSQIGNIYNEDTTRAITDLIDQRARAKGVSTNQMLNETPLEVKDFTNVTGNEHFNIPTNNIPLSKPLSEMNIDELVQHPRFNELMDMRKDVSAVQANKLTNEGKTIGYMNAYGEYRPTTIKQNSINKNYANDFEITKADVKAIQAGKATPQVQQKLANDLGRLDNDPNWKLSNNVAQTNNQIIKGSIETQGNKSVIKIFKDKDVSTILHETGHYFRQTLNDTEKAIADVFFTKNGVWDAVAEEKFTNAFVKYLSEGVAPLDSLKSVFEKMKQWLIRLWDNAIEHNPDNLHMLTDEQRAFFDLLLGKKNKDKLIQAIKENPFVDSVEMAKINNAIRGEANRVGEFKALYQTVSSEAPLDVKINALQKEAQEIFKTIQKPTVEQKAMHDLIMGLKETIGVQRQDAFDVVQVLVQKGYQNIQENIGKGLDHVVFRHYGDGAEGELSTREILNIGKTIQQGKLSQLSVKEAGDLSKAYKSVNVYTRTAGNNNDVKLSVVVGIRHNGIKEVVTYYSDRNIGKTHTGDNLSKLSTLKPQKEATSSTHPVMEKPINKTIPPKDLKENKILYQTATPVQKALDITQTPIVLKTLQKIADFKPVNNVLKKLDTDFVDAFTGHKIYQKKDYMQIREDMMKAKNEHLEQYELLHNQLKLLSNDARTGIDRYMNGQNIELTKPLKDLADHYTNVIKEQGQELVNLGVLEKEQFDKFAGRYLHRSYLKDLTQQFNSMFQKGKTIQGVHTRGNEWVGTKAEYDKLVKQGEIGDFFNGKIEAHRMKNGQYKFSQDWSVEQRTKWGQVEDIAFTLPETLRRMNDMLEHAKMLKKVEQTKYIMDEAVDGYTHLQGKKFGALNGKFVPKDIAHDITEFNRALFGESDGAIFSKEVKENFRILSTFWKKSHTVYNPVGHINNLMSNITMQYMAGINPIKSLSNATKGALALQKYNQFLELQAKKIIGLTVDEVDRLKALEMDDDLILFKKAKEQGLFGRSGLNDILNKYVNNQSTNKTGLLNKIDDKLSSLYQGEDGIMRFSLLKALVDKGSDFNKALIKVNNTIPDYTKPMSRMAILGRNSMLTPFISWTYYSTPILLKQMAEQPIRAVALFGMLYAINKAMGIDPYNEEDISQKNFAMKRIPIYKNGDEVTTIKVDKWIPHGEMFSPFDFVKNLTSGGAWSGAYGVLNNRDMYYGGKITYKDGADKAYDLTKNAMQQITPDVLDGIYNLVETKVRNKDKRINNPVNIPRTTTQELLKLIGLNTLTYNKAEQKNKINKEYISKQKKEEKQ